MKLQRTIVKWINRFGENRQHTLFNASHNYAANWFRTVIVEYQGVLTIDESRESKLKLVAIEIIP